PCASSAVHHSFPTRRSSDLAAVDAFLARIEAQDHKLGAFTEVYAEDARLAAAAADQARRAGHALGPLHGVPIALKDLIEIEGRIDRKSTRLNSSHVSISYAV